MESAEIYGRLQFETSHVSCAANNNNLQMTNMIGFFYLSGQEIKRSPFNVKIGPHKTSKIKAYGPGLKGGIVNKPAKFTVDTCGETGALGFSIEGPSQVVLLKVCGQGGSNP